MMRLKVFNTALMDTLAIDDDGVQMTAWHRRQYSQSSIAGSRLF